MLVARHSSTMYRRTAAAAAVAVMLAWAAGAGAAPADEDGGAVGVAASVRDTVTAGAGDIWRATSSIFSAPELFDVLPERMSAESQAFLVMMNAAGYRLAAIDTGGHLLSSVRYRFVQERVPSLGDLDRVRRGLAEHRERFSGATAAAERRALRGLLALADAQGFRVAAVDLKVLPWPAVSFHLTALDRPLTESEQRLLKELRAPAGAATPAP